MSLALIGFMAGTYGHAQTELDSTRLWQVITTDGNTYLGELLENANGEVRLKTGRLGVLSISKEDIKRMERVNPKQVVQGQLWADNPQATRYLWAPNGYGLRQGEGYYQNTWVFFNQVSVGLSNNFSIGVGMVPLFLFGGLPTPVWVTPKFSVPVVKDKVNLGGGVLVGGIIGDGTELVGVAYGVSTFGSRNHNFTFGLGYGFSGGDWADSPTITLSGMTRISRRGYLMTENYLFGLGSGSSLVLLSGGGRVVWEKISLDFGLVVPMEDGFNIAIPWLGFSVPLGSRSVGTL